MFVVVLHWDVIGVAIATIVSQAISAILVCRELINTTESYKLEIKKIHLHSSLLKKIISIGLPASMQSLMYTSSNIVVQSSINTFGTDTMAAWTAFAKIDGIFWMILAAFGISITTFVGQNYGAGNNDRAKTGVKVCLQISMGVAIFLSIFLYITGPYLYRLFTTDPSVIDIGLSMLYFIAPFYATFVPIEVFTGALRGLGNTLLPMLMTGLGVCVLRVSWVIFAVPIWPNIKTVIMSYPITWIVTSILFIFYFKYYLEKEKI